MERTPKISCVMPARDRGHLISDTIQSILDQTIEDWELIIVDDHSKEGDSTEEVVKSFKDERIKYYKLSDENGIGIPAARNFGTMMAKSEYIAVVDSDDICYPDRLKLSLDKFETDNCDLVYGEIDFWNSETNEVRSRKEVEPGFAAREFDLEYFKKSDFIAHPTVCYKRSIALDFPYNSFFRRAEDYDFLSRLNKFGYKFSFIDKSLVKYRDHEESITKQKLTSGIHYSEVVRKNRGWL